MSTDKKLWFKRRRYGWGWVPVTWQGFASLAVFIAIVLVAAFELPVNTAASAGQLVMFFGIFAVALVALVVTGVTKGPRPRWRWGKKPDDDPDEDY